MKARGAALLSEERRHQETRERLAQAEAQRDRVVLECELCNEERVSLEQRAQTLAMLLDNERREVGGGGLESRGWEQGAKVWQPLTCHALGCWVKHKGVDPAISGRIRSSEKYQQTAHAELLAACVRNEQPGCFNCGCDKMGIFWDMTVTRRAGSHVTRDARCNPPLYNTNFNSRVPGSQTLCNETQRDVRRHSCLCI